MRVAEFAAHYIAHEVGHDPGHINVKGPAGWEALFKDRVPIACTVGNPIILMSPVFLHMHELPPHIRHASGTFIPAANNLLADIAVNRQQEA